MEIGKLKLKSRIIFAPMAGCSDFPTRRIVREFGSHLIYCEMMKIEPLTRGIKSVQDILEYQQAMHPIGAQLCGSDPLVAAEAARMIEERGFDILDFNCGCPVKKIVKDGSGSGMLKNLDQLGEVLSAISKAVSIPVTIKIRAGWDEKSACAEDVVKIAEELQIKAITVHGRTREQLYRGKSDWQYIKRCKEVSKSIKVIGNGDIFTVEDAKAMFEETGCDGILIARGYLGRPWFASQIDSSAPITPLFVKETLLRHLSYVLSYRSGKKAFLDTKKVVFWYLKACSGTKPLRLAVADAQSVEHILDLIQTYPWASYVKI